MLTSRERVLRALNHQEPDRVPLDLGGSATTGMHVSSVYQLRQALHLDPPGTPVKVIEPYQMLGEIQPDLMDALGVDVVSIHATPDGSFPRPAEPLPENLGALCDLVRQQRCDIGFAQDMDADRLAIVDETGTPIGEDYTLVLAAWRVLSMTPGVVVANLSTTAALDDLAGRFGCRVIRTKIGEANVTERMRAEKAVIGGEGNGGVIYPRINFGRDSLVGMALVLHLLASHGRALTDLLADLPRYRLVKSKLECPSNVIPALLRMLKREYESYPIDTRDGVKVTLPAGWFHVRGSNTEPIVRIYAEARNQKQADELAKKVAKYLK